MTSRSELLERLAEQNACKMVVITPNRRLAQDLRREYDSAQLARNLLVWPAADILPLGSFVDREWQALDPDQEYLVLSAAQELILWQEIIAASPNGKLLRNIGATARLVQQAWNQAVRYRLDLDHYRGALNQDVTEYHVWSQRFRAQCDKQHWIDQARLPDAIISALGKRSLQPGQIKTIVYYGFDQPSPQLIALFEAFAIVGHAIIEAGGPVRQSSAYQFECVDAECELRMIATRTRDLSTKNPALRIGVVVLDLDSRRDMVERIFDDVFEPQRVLDPANDRQRAYNISVGRALLDFPLIHTAQLVMRLASQQKLSLTELGSLLRSPFATGAEVEQQARAQLDASVRSRRRNVVKLSTLQVLIERQKANLPELHRRIGDWVTLVQITAKQRQLPSAWIASIAQLLKSWGWPGDRSLSSEEYQTVERFRVELAHLTQFDVILGKINLASAVNLLSQNLTDVVFQAETTYTSIQILGALEAAGLEFDHLMVSGLTDEAWPIVPQPNPFLPLKWQRIAQVAGATAEWNLEFAKRMYRQWLGAATALECSYPKRDGDRELQASPLIKYLPTAPVVIELQSTVEQLIFTAKRREYLQDNQGLPLPTGIKVRGGTQVFKNQAACAFRAYATHRLGATGLEGSHDGLDAAERGVLAHATLACLMQKIASRDSLESLSREDKHQIIDESVKSALNRLLERDPDVISEEFAKLEVMRLTQLCENLLEQELQREPFAVKAVEEKRVMRFAGIEWDGQIDRIDLWRSGNLIIDYKTGKISKNALQGERPDEPQLPLYALTTEANNGVMYIGLQNGDINYQGFLSSKVEQFRSNNTKSKNIEHIEHWEHQLIDWKRVLTRLAEDFKAGDASVDPKKFPQTCEYCELKAVCRVREIYGMADGDEEEEGLIDDSNQALGEV